MRSPEPLVVRSLRRGEDALWRACTWRTGPRRRRRRPPFTAGSRFVAERHLLALRGGRVVGRLEWVRNGHEAALCDPVVVPGEDVAEVAGTLLAEALRRARRRVPKVEAILDERLPYVDALEPVLARIGLLPTRRRLLHLRRGRAPREVSPRGFTFAAPRGLLDPVLVAVYARCSGQTPEQVRRSLRASAQERATDWRTIVLAFDGERPAGLAVPGVHDGAGPLGTIEFVGVLPEARGRGLGLALTVRVIRTLAARGARQMLDATDEGNEPMLAVFRKTGYRLRTVQRYYGPRG